MPNISSMGDDAGTLSRSPGGFFKSLEVFNLISATILVQV